MRTPRYLSDLTDAQWALVEPLLPVYPGGRPRTTRLRDVLGATFYLLHSGCQWRSLPDDVPPRSTVWRSFDEAYKPQFVRRPEGTRGWAKLPLRWAVGGGRWGGRSRGGHVPTADGGPRAKRLPGGGVREAGHGPPHAEPLRTKARRTSVPVSCDGLTPLVRQSLTSYRTITERRWSRTPRRTGVQCPHPSRSRSSTVTSTTL